MPDSRRSRRFFVLLGLLAATVAATLLMRWERPGDEEDAEEAPSTAPKPLGPAHYARQLKIEAGGPIDPRELAARARAVAAELETLLDQRARRLDPAATDWRAVYARLQDNTPATGEAVLAAYQQEIERALEFCRERDLVPLSPRPSRIFAIENPTLRRLFPLAMNRGDGTLGITLEPPAGEGDAALYRRNHCRVCIPPIAVHESYPGHDVAFALTRADGATTGRWPFFHEGWAQYAEVLMWEAGYWADDPALEMGALRLMLLRAIRAEVDAELHVRALTPQSAERLYAERLLLDSDAAASEVAGHLQAAGKKASYLVGALEILALRDRLGSPRGAELRGFHERFLRRAGAIPEIARTEFGVKIPALPSRGLLSPGA